MGRAPARVEPPEPSAQPVPAPRKARVAPARNRVPGALDGLIVALFLGLTFLLGIFPLNDTDFWWHLRTGDLIRQSGKIPHQDIYTFGAAGHAWIDLHWGFQVAISWIYEHGGVEGLNLAKCAVTTLAVAVLLFARRRDWPIWVMALAWMPALLLLSGRMYVRPETVTLLEMALTLAIVTRIDRRPWLIYLLPVVQVLWVNTQGLFIFGPILLAMALIDAGLRRGAFARERFGWWRTILLGTALTAAACLLNPYGIFGALFPIQLLGTMGNPVFRQIMELQPIFDLGARLRGQQPLTDFIAKVGWRNLPLQLQVVTLIVGLLSFVVPATWSVVDRFRNPVEPPKARKSKKAAAKVEDVPGSWRLRPFRILLFVAFSFLSFRASRNSHQFAAVVGALSAWNFGEWAAAWNHRRKGEAPAIAPRLLVLGLVGAAIVMVATGRFYEWTGEGRTVALGERPLWYPHEAVKFAGKPGMPTRFLTYHNGHAGLFEYHNGPDRKVFADARLEVMGPEVYGQDQELGEAIASDRPGWSDRVEGIGSPVPGILLDHVQPLMSRYAGTLLSRSDWRCVWYDPIASVYVHRSNPDSFPPVDFAARHFGKQSQPRSGGREALLALAKVAVGQVSEMSKRGASDRAESLSAMGLGFAREAIRSDPADYEGWKLLGQSLILRERPLPRVGRPFDPIYDLNPMRARYALDQADTRRPGDIAILTSLMMADAFSGSNESAAEVADRLVAQPIEPEKAVHVMPEVAEIREKMKPKLSTRWSNVGDLERVVSVLVENGRAKTAADILEKGYARPESRSWEVTDRLATLRLRLGRPDLARELWQAAKEVPRPALRDARVAATYLVENDFDAARREYRRALAAEPTLFEAHFGLAVLETDDGRAGEALASAKAAESSAASEVGRITARRLAEFVEPYARPSGLGNQRP